MARSAYLRAACVLLQSCPVKVLPRSASVTDSGKERAFVAILLLPHTGSSRSYDPSEEIIGLVEAAGAQVVGHLSQSRAVPSPAFAFGKGKVHEIATEAKALNAEFVVVDCELSPSQIRNLEKVLEMRVVDRTELILDIFASRAQTHQAMLQVELAQTESLKTRLVRMWTHLERTEGAIGTRGPGETQLETDRRLVGKKITILKKRLKEIECRRRREAIARDDPHTISLVGYTNAGKSSLLRRLTGSEVYVADQLFATLDTRVRRWKLADGRAVILADTVGFVRDLPHHLVASFHATLEETLQADLLLHVCDASSPNLAIQLEAVEEVLSTLDVAHIPLLLVLNKADRLNDEERLMLTAQYPEGALVSVIEGDGLVELEQVIADTLDAWSLDLQVAVPAAAGRVLADIRRLAAIREEEWRGETWHARLTLEPRHWQVIEPALIAQGGQGQSA